MRIPTVKYCCCCIKLRTGALILGWLGLIVSPLNVLILMYQIYNHDDLMEEARRKNTDPDSVGGLYTQKLEENALLYKVFLIWSMILYLLAGVAAVYLLLGTYKRNAKYVKIYLAMCICITVCSLGAQFIFFANITPGPFLIHVFLIVVIIDASLLGKKIQCKFLFWNIFYSFKHLFVDCGVYFVWYATKRRANSTLLMQKSRGDFNYNFKNKWKKAYIKVSIF